MTYPSRAVGLLTPGFDRLPKIAFDYLRLVGPAVLAALAAVNIMVVVGDDDVPSFHIGIEWVAILAALAIVAWRKNLFLGLVAAVPSWPSPGRPAWPRSRPGRAERQPRRASTSISTSSVGSMSA